MAINRSSIGQQIMKAPLKKKKVVKKSSGTVKALRGYGTAMKKGK